MPHLGGDVRVRVRGVRVGVRARVRIRVRVRRDPPSEVGGVVQSG